jgi:hypothetical protein
MGKVDQVGTILTNQPNDHLDSSDLASPPRPGHVAAPVRRALGISRIGYAVGALVVIAGAAAILFTGALSPSTPATPVKVEPANTVALPPMSNGMGSSALGSTNGLGGQPVALPPMSYPQPTFLPSDSTVQCSTQLACRESHGNTIQAPTQSVAEPASSFGTFDFSTYHPTAGIPAQSSDSASTLQCPTVLVTCQSSNGVQVPAPSSTRPATSNHTGYWDRIQPPTQPDPELSTNVGYGDFTTYPTFAP